MQHNSNNFLTFMQSMLDTESLNEPQSQLSEGPVLYYTNTIGTKDKARRDILQYIQEKKTLKEQQGSSMSMLQTSEFFEGANESVEQTADHCDQQVASEKASVSSLQELQEIVPSIVYTNSPSLKARAKRDILEYINQKKAVIHSLSGVHQTESDESKKNTLDSLLCAGNEGINKGIETPVIQYTKDPGTRKKFQEDIINYIQDKKQKGSSASVSNQEAPKLKYTKDLAIKRQNLKDILSYIQEKAQREEHDSRKN